MSRRLARELALKVLYQHDLVESDPEAALAHLAVEEGATPEARGFARDLIDGVLAHRAELDGKIAAYARDWRLERIAPVDRNILRLGIYEVLHRPDVPTSVAINEAVELAKAYGEDDSGRFINGILGQLAKDRDAADDTAEGGSTHHGDADRRKSIGGGDPAGTGPAGL